MLEILLIAYLVISVPITIFFLLAFTVAQQADRSLEGIDLEGTDKLYPYQQPNKKKVHFKKSLPFVAFDPDINSH